MDSRYHEFVWLTVKDFCKSCAICSVILAFSSMYFMAQSIVFIVTLMLGLFFTAVFILGNRMAHYIATMIELEREDQSTQSVDAVTT